MTTPDSKNGVKTIGTKFQPDLHAQLTLIVQLRGSSLQDEVTKAVAAHVAAAKTDPELLQKVEQAQAEIAQQAKDRQATIAELFEAPVSAGTGTKPAKATGARAGIKPS